MAHEALLLGYLDFIPAINEMGYSEGSRLTSKDKRMSIHRILEKNTSIWSYLPKQDKFYKYELG